MFAMQLLTPLYQLQGLLTVSLFQAALILFTILVFFRTLRRTSTRACDTLILSNFK